MASEDVVKIGVLGLTNDHIWEYIQNIQSCENAELVAVADPNEELLAKAQTHAGCNVYAEYEEMLEKEEIQAVYVYSNNAASVQLAEMAAKENLYVMIEKPLAESLAGADYIVAISRLAHVRLMVNWPFAWWPQLQYALEMVESGMIGEVWQVKYRAAHAGPKEIGCSSYFSDWLFDPALSGGGAFAHYTCYGALLARLIMGMPARVSGFAGRYAKHDIMVEDNGLLVMTYSNGLAISEASWTQIGYLSSYVAMIYGSTGTLMVEPQTNGRLFHATEKEPYGNQIHVPDAPPHMLNETVHFTSAVLSGEPFAPMVSYKLARDTQEIVEGGLQSARIGKEISLPIHRFPLKR